MRDPINIPSAECLLFIRQLSDWRKKVTGVVRDAAQHHLVPLGYKQQQKSGPVIQVVSHSQAVGVFHYCQFELSAANDLFRKKKTFRFGRFGRDVQLCVVGSSIGLAARKRIRNYRKFYNSTGRS